MIQVDAGIVIKCPVEEVFVFLADHRNDVRWQEGLLEVRVMPEGSVGLGTRVTAVRKFLGRRAESTTEVSEFIANQKEAFKTVAGPVYASGWMLCRAQDGSTAVSQHVEMQTHGFFAFADPVVAASLRRVIAAGLGDVKDLLESGIARARRSGV